MRVLLRSDVAGVGKRGDLVEVSGGFARNFLFPTSRALKATDGMTAQAASMRRGRDLRDSRDREAAQTVATVLSSAKVTVSARAGAEGRLFGSVSAADVVRALQDQTGAVLDRHQVILDEPIKQVGAHVVPIQLRADVRTEVTVEVVPAN